MATIPDRATFACRSPDAEREGDHQRAVEKTEGDPERSRRSADADNSLIVWSR